MKPGNRILTKRGYYWIVFINKNGQVYVESEQFGTCMFLDKKDIKYAKVILK